MKNYTFLFSLLVLPLLLACTCKTTQPTTGNSSDDSFIKNEILVQLTDAATPRQLETDFNSYDFKQKKVISRETNLWLFTYDTSLIEPEKMLEKVKTSAHTVDAEFNKRLNIRN